MVDGASLVHIGALASRVRLRFPLGAPVPYDLVERAVTALLHQRRQASGAAQ